VADRQPEVAVIMPPRATAVPSAAASTKPTQRNRDLQGIAEKGRAWWQKMSGYNKRSRVEAAIGRYKQVIGDGLRARKDQRRTTEVGIAVHVLNRMLAFGRPDWSPECFRGFRHMQLSYYCLHILPGQVISAYANDESSPM
jgi:hypothetical protein